MFLLGNLLLSDTLLTLCRARLCSPRYVFLFCSEAVIGLTANESVGGTIQDGSSRKWLFCIEGRIRVENTGEGKYE
jgi:hypothetical protein